MQGENIPKTCQSAQWKLSSSWPRCTLTLGGYPHLLKPSSCPRAALLPNRSSNLHLRLPDTRSYPLSHPAWQVQQQKWSQQLAGYQCSSRVTVTAHVACPITFLCWLDTRLSRWRARKQCSCGQAAADAAEPRCLPAKRQTSAIAWHSLPGQRAIWTEWVCSLWTNSALPGTGHFISGFLGVSTVVVPCECVLDAGVLAAGSQISNSVGVQAAVLWQVVSYSLIDLRQRIPHHSWTLVYKICFGTMHSSILCGAEHPLLQ